MGITTYLFHQSNALEKQRFNMFFLDMGENIHFHYRDLRIELSVGEFVELAELFNRYAKDVLVEIENGYKDGVFANTNEAGTLKTFWEKEKKLQNPVKYHEQQLSIEETKDGYHLHIRNYKILLFKESFSHLVKAIAPILPLLEQKELTRDPLLLLRQNELNPKLISRYQTEEREELVVEVGSTFRNKAAQVLKAIGYSMLEKRGEKKIYVKGQSTVTIIPPGSTHQLNIASPDDADNPVRLDIFLCRYGASLDAEQLNTLKLKILHLLKMAENKAIAPFTLENLFIHQQSLNPVVDLFSRDQDIEMSQEIDRFKKMLVANKLFFIKPQKKFLPAEQQLAVEDAFFSFVMEKLAVHEWVRKIYVLGSSNHHSLGRYSVPFVHFDWVKIHSDFDIYIELDPDMKAAIPKEWEKKFYWPRAGSDYYHFGEIGDGMSSDAAWKYPGIRFYDHLVEGYLFDPAKGDKARRDKWFSEAKVKCIFSRDITGQWISKNYDIPHCETEIFKAASFNKVYHVKAEPDDYVLKIYTSKHLSSKNIKKISYEIGVLDFLKDSGLEVALPIKNGNGKYITAKGKDKAVVFTYAPGKYIANPDRKRILLAGNLVARFHTTARRFKTKHANNYRYKDAISYWLKVWKEYHEQKVIGTSCHLNIPKYIKIINEFNAFPTHCHGDLSLINFLFEDERCWLIDFQSIVYGPALLDLANGMVEFSARKKEFLFDNIDYFKEGYEEIRPLSKIESSTLKDLLIVMIAVRQAKLIRLHYGGFGYELKEDRILGLHEGLVQLLQH